MLSNIWTDRPVTSIVTAVVVTAAIRVAEQRPRGWLTRPQTLRVGRSNVPGGGRGVFATEAILVDTVIGAYPVGRAVFSLRHMWGSSYKASP